MSDLKRKLKCINHTAEEGAIEGARDPILKRKDRLPVETS